MALDIKEDKDLNEKFSELFKSNKRNIFLFSLIFIVTYFAISFYLSQGERKQLIASDIYQKVQLAKELDHIEALTSELKNNFPGTVYAARSSIFLGNIYFKNKDYSKAGEFYIWASKNTSESSISSLANYQYGIMLHVEKKYELAIRVVKEIKDNGFIGLKNNLLGDIYQSAGESTLALEHFQLAYDFYDNKNDLAKVIKLKIDAISKN